MSALQPSIPCLPPCLPTHNYPVAPNTNICEATLPIKSGKRGPISFLPYFQKKTNNNKNSQHLFCFSVLHKYIWMPLENKFLHLHQWAYASRNLLYKYIQSPPLQLRARFSCQTCTLLLKEQIKEWTKTPQDYRSLKHAFRPWIFMLISLHKHFHTRTEPPGFVGRSKLKQKGRKNTMLCRIRGMETTYWTVITKIDVCHSTEGTYRL